VPVLFFLWLCGNGFGFQNNYVKLFLFIKF